MFDKALDWTGYKSWGSREVQPEFLWSHSTQEEIVKQLRTEWSNIYKDNPFPATLEYLDSDEKLNSLKSTHKGITAYPDPSLVNYTINNLGFRGDWSLDDNDYVKVGFFGCSFTYGIGIAEDDLYVTLITKELSKKLGKQCKAYNCGTPGGAVGKATRYYSMLSKLIKFDYVIFVMPHTGRVEYPLIRQDKTISWNIIPNWKDTDTQGERLRLKVYEALDDNFLNSDFIRNINHCESIAKSHNSKIYFSSWDQITYEYLYNYYIKQDQAKLLPWFQSLEYHIDPRKLLGRDGIHPGPRSHIEFAKRAMDYIS